MKKKTITRKSPTRVHSFRCTDEEWRKLQELAGECGISFSRYVVETGLNHHPRKRLNAEEVHAIDSLIDARQDLIKIRNILAGLSDGEKAKYFRSEKFMRWWTDATAELVRHWYSIEENITSSVQTKNEKQT